MSDTISRRNLLAVTGAGLALSACKGKDLFEETTDRRWKMLGGGPDWGASPTTDPSTIPGDPYKEKFKPGFIALVHVEPATDWTMSVNYASFKLPGVTDDDTRLSRAVRVFSEKVSGKKKFRDLDPTTFPDRYFFKQHGCHDFDDLENFKFKTQNEIFFFFDNPNITFEGHPLMSVTPKNSKGAPCDLNYSFLGASLVDDNKIGTMLKGRGKILRVRNYVMHVTKDGKYEPITDPQFYSLNIQFTVRDADRRNPLPIIFDPDTGNGQGYEP